MDILHFTAALYISELVKYGQDLISYLHSPADDADASSRHRQ